MELVMDHMKGMVDGLKTGEKKEKVPPMHEETHTRKHHPFKRTVTVHHSHGGHSTTHEHDTDPTKDVSYASDHLDGVLSGMQENVGTPNEGEPQADAGQHGVPEEIAEKAGLPSGAPVS